MLKETNYTKKNKEYVDYLKFMINELSKLTGCQDIHGSCRQQTQPELIIWVPKNKLRATITALKEDPFNYVMLADLTALDYPDKAERFTLVYNLVCFKHNLRCRIKTDIAEMDNMDSMVDLYPNANWLEREVWDMFGIWFHNHPDLRRILTDYGFVGHPLRKDFPLGGYYELFYDEELKQNVYRPTVLTHMQRHFHD